MEVCKQDDHDGDGEGAACGWWWVVGSGEWVVVSGAERKDGVAEKWGLTLVAALTAALP
jgi:hypothetical protein